MNIKLKISPMRVSLGAYLLLVMVFLTLVSPLRAIGLFEPGEIRNMLLPPILLGMVLAYGVGNVIWPRSIMHVVLLMAFFQAMIVGISNGINPETTRNYLSHLFQVASAYVMLGVGWGAGDRLGFEYWKKFTVIALVSALLSTAITLILLGRGEIGRLYTPAYTYIFIASFCALYSKKMSILTILGLLVSNKRGPIMAVLLMFLQSILTTMLGKRQVSRKKLVNKLVVGVCSISFVVLLGGGVVQWASRHENQSNAVAQSVNITYDRLKEVFFHDRSEQTLNEISSGRIDEIESALNSLSGLDYIFGEGAGWEVVLQDGGIVHNIHFTPLSLISVFGAPFAIFLYGFLVYLIIHGSVLVRRHADLTTTERMAPLYLTGALFHSFTAYSLFIDLLVFFFSGVLLKAIKRRSSSPSFTLYKKGQAVT